MLCWIMAQLPGSPSRSQARRAASRCSTARSRSAPWSPAQRAVEHLQRAFVVLGLGVGHLAGVKTAEGLGGVEPCVPAGVFVAQIERRGAVLDGGLKAVPVGTADPLLVALAQKREGVRAVEGPAQRIVEPGCRLQVADGLVDVLHAVAGRTAAEAATHLVRGYRARLFTDAQLQGTPMAG